MGKLHEVLAVDKELEVAQTKIIEEAITTFTKKADHFLGNHKILKMYDDARKDEENGFAEDKEVTTTVQDKLDYVAPYIVRHFDAIAQKDATNQIAKADITLPDGTILISGVPATLLLTLENKLIAVRKMYEVIPTLTPGIKWVEDTEKGEKIFRAEPDEIRHKTEKALTTKVVFQPTDKQAGQYEKWTEDKPVGDYINTRWSSMISPARKSQLLGKIEILIRAVKQARQRANEAEVVKLDIGQKLIDFINS